MKEDNRKLVIFLVSAFAIAYALQFAAMSSGNMLVYQLLILISMFAPAAGLAISHKGLSNAKTGVNWKFKIKGNVKCFLSAWLLPAAFTILGAAFYFALFPKDFDAGCSMLASSLPADMNVPVWALVAVQFIFCITLAPAVNMLFAVGEEAGWRGYLTPALMKRLSRRAALLISGIIWGAWHFPLIIFAGYQYGIGYYGAPFTGIIAMCVFTTSVGIFLSYLYERSKCIWVPAAAHGAINAVAAIGLYFTDGSMTSYILGPTLAGLVSVLPMAIAAVVLMMREPNGNANNAG